MITIIKNILSILKLLILYVGISNCIKDSIDIAIASVFIYFFIDFIQNDILRMIKS